jgi:hypothetical protein
VKKGIQLGLPLAEESIKGEQIGVKEKIRSKRGRMMFSNRT